MKGEESVGASPGASAKNRREARPDPSESGNWRKTEEAQQPDDGGLVIVDDMPDVDQERINEERRAYLEESRSQEAFD